MQLLFIFVWCYSLFASSSHSIFTPWKKIHVRFADDFFFHLERMGVCFNDGICVVFDLRFGHFPHRFYLLYVRQRRVCVICSWLCRLLRSNSIAKTLCIKRIKGEINGIANILFPHLPHILHLPFLRCQRHTQNNICFEVFLLWFWSNEMFLNLFWTGWTAASFVFHNKFTGLW